MVCFTVGRCNSWASRYRINILTDQEIKLKPPKVLAVPSTSTGQCISRGISIKLADMAMVGRINPDRMIDWMIGNWSSLYILLQQTTRNLFERFVTRLREQECQVQTSIILFQTTRLQLILSENLYGNRNLNSFCSPFSRQPDYSSS